VTINFFLSSEDLKFKWTRIQIQHIKTETQIIMVKSFVCIESCFGWLFFLVLVRWLSCKVVSGQMSGWGGEMTQKKYSSFLAYFSHLELSSLLGGRFFVVVPFPPPICCIKIQFFWKPQKSKKIVSFWTLNFSTFISHAKPPGDIDPEILSLSFL